jgi:hypothetical protein
VEADQFQIYRYLSSISWLQAEAEAELVTREAAEREVFSQGASVLHKEFHIQQQWVEAAQDSMRDLWGTDQTEKEEPV